MSRGPGPYVNTVPDEASDPMMIYPPMNKTDIGANSVGMPKSQRQGGGKMGIEHVGGTTKGT